MSISQQKPTLLFIPNHLLKYIAGGNRESRPHQPK